MCYNYNGDKIMEYFDVLNKTRKDLNYTKIRGIKLEENEYNQGAELWLINNGKLLITKRSLEKSHPGEWETPGGCSQKGETSLDTIIREANEEIGISLTENDLELIGTQLYKKQFVDIFLSKKLINEFDIKLQTSEVVEFKFVSKDEFISMIENNKMVKSVTARYFMVKDILDSDW